MDLEIKSYNISNAGVAELADALDLGSSAERRGGSSPSTRTTKIPFKVYMLMNDIGKVLIIIASNNNKVYNTTLDIVEQKLKNKNIECDTVRVNRVLDAPVAANMFIENLGYEGLIIVGNITLNSEMDKITGPIIYQECISTIYELSVYHSISIGNGIFIARNDAEAESLIAEYAEEAVLGCLRLMLINNKEKD
jgi:6,7-dimethyl-8-ribityllumazine synthase